MNEEAILAIWEQNFKTLVPYSEFRSDFELPEVRSTIHTDYYKDKVSFEEFETSVGISSAPVKPEDDGNVFTRTWDRVKTAAASGWDTGKNLSEGVNALVEGKDLDESEVEAVAQILQQNEKERKGDNTFTAKLARGEKLSGVNEWVGWAAEITAQSGAMMLRGALDAFTNSKTAATLAGGAGAGAAAGAGLFGLGAVPTGIAGAMGSVSGMTEASTIYFDELEKELNRKGLDSDATSIKGVISDENWLADVRKRAATKGAVIGSIDAITGLVTVGIGTRSAKRIAEQGLKGMAKAKELSTTVAKGFAVEGTGGGGGEALGSVAIGEEVDPMAVLGEIVGEAIGTGVNIITPYMSKDVRTAQAKAKVAEARKLDLPVTQAEKVASEKSLSMKDLIDAYNTNDDEVANRTLADMAVRHSVQDFTEMLEMSTETEGLSAEEKQRMIAKFEQAKAAADSLPIEDLGAKSDATAEVLKRNDVDAKIAEITQVQQTADEALKAGYDTQIQDLQAQREEINAGIQTIAQNKPLAVEDDPVYHETLANDLETGLAADKQTLSDKQNELFSIGKRLEQDIMEGSRTLPEYQNSKSKYITAFMMILLLKKEKIL